MKKFLMLAFIMLNAISSYADRPNEGAIANLIEAISYVESKHDNMAVSKCGKYVGVLQISKTCVDDCNRILGKNKYTYSCRYDAKKSYEMFYIIQNYYNPEYNIYKAIRIWNEGPSYNKEKKKTIYLNKVMTEYAKMFN